MPFENELSVIKKAVYEAGSAINKIAQGDFETTIKEDNSPLTIADLECNRILKEAVSNNFPDDGWLSEETVDDTTRLDKSRVWIVDPIDGTKEFIKNTPEFAISVALVENGKPVLGIIYNPLADEFYEARKGCGTKFNERPATCNHKLGEKPLLEASRSDMEKGRFKDFESTLEIKPCGSIAYKLARLSRGCADTVFSLTPKNEWDFAAGVILVTEAGGRVARRSGEPFTFNHPNTLVDGIIAASSESYDKVIDLINTICHASN